MKSIHFCTPNKLKEIKENTEFYTIRTGWITHLYPGDTVKINQFQKNSDDLFLFNAEVQDVFFMKFSKLMESASIYDLEEVDRYGKKFHNDHFFFRIKFKKVK